LIIIIGERGEAAAAKKISSTFQSSQMATGFELTHFILRKAAGLRVDKK
jgi:hypothetical protein